MTRSATARLKVNPPLGNLPALQWALVSQLQVDGEYQRSVEAGSSQSLIRKIAQHWNWDLCQPLVVSRRQDGGLFVIDGQHRLCAAKLRGDINQLPCVVVDYASAADEAASFVHLNQQRRPLSKLDVFKAAVASEDPEACAIVQALYYAGLSIAPHSNYVSWKPGMVSNIGGIESAWRQHGPKVVQKAFWALKLGFEGQVLRYAGTIFPGLVAVCSDELLREGDFAGARFEVFCAFLRSKAQKDWRGLMMQYRAEEPDVRYGEASAQVLRREWRKHQGAQAPAELQFEAQGDGKAWCDQCDGAVTKAEAEGCRSRFCSLRKAA